MKVEAASVAYMSVPSKKEKNEGLGTAIQGASEPASDSERKTSSSGPSVGQLAAQLARAETRMDVLQVSSKATKALMELQMASAMSEGDEKEKVTLMIRRMEKLMKRIQKKLKLLGKEEQLEYRRRQAEEKEQLQKQEELRAELHKKRKSRRKDEQAYAVKEMQEDEKESSQELVASVLGVGAVPRTMPELSVPAGYGGAAVPAAEGFSLDVLA